MDLEVRKAGILDIGFLSKLEEQSFFSFQRGTKQSLKHSVESPFQEVLIVEEKGKINNPVGSLVLFKYPKSLRIYSIAVLPEHQNKGYGNYLLKHAIEFANRNQQQKILLEVSVKNSNLINWYNKMGFCSVETIVNYYAPGEDAVKMELKTSVLASSQKTSNIIVINQPYKWTFPDTNATVISVKEYINNPIYQTNTDFRVFNLCSSYKYQSYGYYVSLLASARGQRIIPSTITIRDFPLLSVINSAAYDIEEIINDSLKKVKKDTFSLNIYFGQTRTKGYSALAKKLHQLFDAPLFKADFVKHDKWIINKLQIITLHKIPDIELEFVYASASKYFSKKRFRNTKLVNYKYDIAILVNPQEATPPSCPKALQKFKAAANRKGLYVEFITKKDIDKINEFDALFIRETTSVNNHTYEFSRMAYAEGLVVLDDPWSILRCSNKIYQNEILKKHKIGTPATTIFTKNFFDKKVLSEMNFPLVLKQPDSAFSLGVTKVEDKEEALEAINNLFKKSDMIVCQEFMYSDFDWRIGVLDNKPLFACKYYMSKGHWQIYNWKGEAEDNAGQYETLSIESVPDLVVQTALKAAALIGDGLYGVDLKMIDGKVYVVEVNDNPNIDDEVEDLVLKDKLYDMIIQSFYNRIEVAKNVQKINFTK